MQTKSIPHSYTFIDLIIDLHIYIQLMLGDPITFTRLERTYKPMLKLLRDEKLNKYWQLLLQRDFPTFSTTDPNPSHRQLYVQQFKARQAISGLDPKHKRLFTFIRWGHPIQWHNYSYGYKSFFRYQPNDFMEVRDTDGTNAMDLARRYNRREFCENLYKNSVSKLVGGKDYQGRSQLDWAVICGMSAEVTRLLSEGSKINQTESNGWTPICFAACYGKPEIADILVKAGANINHITLDGSQPIHIAAEAGNSAMVAFLLRLGVSSNAKTPEGVTPFFLAVTRCRSDVALLMFLMSKEIAIDEPTNYGVSPLYAAAEAGHVDMVALLLQVNAAIDRINPSNGATPLIIAAANGHAPVVDLLIKAGAQINISNGNYTPIFIAGQHGNTKTVQLLLAAGATDVGRSLHMAAFNGHAETVAVLLTATRNLAFDKVAIYLAIRRGHYKLVETLLTIGVIENLISSAETEGAKLISTAEENGHEAIAQLLKLWMVKYTYRDQPLYKQIIEILKTPSSKSKWITFRTLFFANKSTECLLTTLEQLGMEASSDEAQKVKHLLLAKRNEIEPQTFEFIMKYIIPVAGGEIGVESDDIVSKSEKLTKMVV